MEIARSLAKIRKIYFLLLVSKVNGKIKNNKTKQKQRMKLCTTKCHKCKQKVKNRKTMDKAIMVRTSIEQRRTEKRNKYSSQIQAIVLRSYGCKTASQNQGNYGITKVIQRYIKIQRKRKSKYMNHMETHKIQK